MNNESRTLLDALSAALKVASDELTPEIEKCTIPEQSSMKMSLMASQVAILQVKDAVDNVLKQQAD